MRKKTGFYKVFAFSVFLAMLLVNLDFARQDKGDSNLDKKVKKFLENHRGQWYDMNVPESDGKVLFDLVVKHQYKKALEIGTSTGHSAIWIAWALSKTGGKLVTIEINESRYKQAVANFKEAGLWEYIDARLADAHKLVPQLEGPFDFVFCDADKGWYKNYFAAILPKLEVGGCYTAHNVSMGFGRRRSGIKEFLDYVKRLPNMETTIVDSSYSGISLSYKKSEK
ncbi:MAG: class I SAM-dependent methyltransferase [Candidatus Aminicenantes bacterium]|nr:MAG: class I SAM-dependent methyltransferase [Candidatus Aminicenantes bacterium]